jgi:hypothetical protein
MLPSPGRSPSASSIVPGAGGVAPEKFIDGAIEPGERVGGVQQCGEVAERIGAAIDANVHDRTGTRSCGRRTFHDQDRRRHSPACVAAGRLAGDQGGKEPMSKRSRGTGERFFHGRPHVGREHHVRLHREAVADDVAGVVDAQRAGMGRRGAVDTDDADLTENSHRIGGLRRRQRVGCPGAGGQFVEAARSVGRLGDRLRGDRADPGSGPRHDRTHGNMHVWTATPTSPVTAHERQSNTSSPDL